MREPQLLQQLDLVAPPHRDAPGRPLSDAVQRQDGRLLEGGREEGARGVGLVVLEEDVATRVGAAEAPVELPGREELLLEPEREAHQEQAEARRGVRDVRLEQPVELEQGLVVEGDEVEILGAQPGLGQAEIHGVLREAVIVLLAREALLLHRGDDLAVAHQAGRAVVIKGRDPEDVHRILIIARGGVALHEHPALLDVALIGPGPRPVGGVAGGSLV